MSNYGLIVPYFEGNIEYVDERYLSFDIRFDINSNYISMDFPYYKEDKRDRFSKYINKYSDQHCYRIL